MRGVYDPVRKPEPRVRVPGVRLPVQRVHGHEYRHPARSAEGENLRAAAPGGRGAEGVRGADLNGKTWPGAECFRLFVFRRAGCAQKGTKPACKIECLCFANNFRYKSLEYSEKMRFLAKCPFTSSGMCGIIHP